MSIGERIREHRKYNKLTQKQLASQLGLTPKMVSFYERNERTPPIDIIIKLSEIFSVSTDYLLGLTHEKPISIVKQKSELSSEEKIILNLYRTLDKDYREIILGELRKCEKMQKLERDHKISKKEA